MTTVAIVASKHDTAFAEAVRAGLQASGNDVSVTQALPKESGAHVVLIWSAALEAAQSIDAQALVGLWSEDRLLVVLRDQTPLPLGLRDLESMDSAKSPLEVCEAVSEAVGSGLPEVKEKRTVGSKLLTVVVLVSVAFGGWYYYSADAVKSTPKVEVAAAAPKAEAPKVEPKSEPVAKAAPEAPKSEAPKQETRVASASSPAAAPGAQTSGADHETLYQQALAMESDGKAMDAIRIYRRAARAGNGKAAKRLGEIYDKGVPGVSRDYAESLQWYETARQLGEPVLTLGRGGEAGTPVPRVMEPVAAKAPPPAPVAPDPESTKAPQSAPGPPVPPKPALPLPAPEPEPPYAIIFGLLFLVALAIVLWRRGRREAPQPQSRAAPLAAQAPADASMLFVSYSHRDRPRVEPIVSLIEGMGRRVWMDRTDITGQTGWAGQIVRAIRECRAVVLMASPNAYRSDQVVRELYLAMNHKKTIVPIEIEPAELPDELQYILAPFQHHRLSGAETRDVLGRALAAV